ncbi:MAG: glutathione peroxidase [Eubacterium sp.]|nr:glutathione peroxidase [Eubacterium sp.]
MGFYDFKVMSNKGEEVSLSDYEGKVLLVVNTATGCGFTPQYEGLQNMYDKYNEKGFEILDFPCNQFAFQAPGNDDKINQFCTVKYKTTFPRFKKIKVNGSDAAPLYKYLKENSDGKRIKWNFTKFLIDRQGNIVGRFAPSDTPASLEAEVEKYL